MTLSAIKAMFAPGTYWKCDRSHPLPNQKATLRKVIRLTSKEIVFDYGAPNHFFTAYPKASEIKEAVDGKIVFQYTNFKETITLTRLEGDAARQAEDFITTYRRMDEAERAAKKNQDEQTTARLDAEARTAREKAILDRETISSEDLIIALRENGFAPSPGTVGTLRKKIVDVSPNSWRWRAQRRPRFTYENQPCKLYMMLHDHLLLQALGEPASSQDEITLDELNHLFGQAPTPPTVSALDLFAA